VISRRLRAAALIGALVCVRADAAYLDDVQDVGFDQHLSATLPLAARFTDERGKSAPLAQFIDGRPAILLLGYYECPNLCSTVRQSLSRSLVATDLEAGKQFGVIAVSIDREGCTPNAATVSSSLFPGTDPSRTGIGWHLLTADAGAISQLAHTVGLRYRYDRSQHQYLHPAGVVIVTPGGRISRYFFGVDFPPDELRKSLLDAASERIASPVERLLLLCFHYDPATGKYSATIETLSRALGAITALALGGFILRLRRRERETRSADT